ncbi:hypothetical protein PAEPH01_2743 [Pancytospora epiphaga]|nr:hypothetical protein PAEPH01_2743 [Pancytospora epiphaga]
MKKFEYDLRGRRFILITDHKAFEEMRKKTQFETAKMARWIELIQEFNF